MHIAFTAPRIEGARIKVYCLIIRVLFLPCTRTFIASILIICKVIAKAFLAKSSDGLVAVKPSRPIICLVWCFACSELCRSNATSTFVSFAFFFFFFLHHSFWPHTASIESTLHP